ncbi:hypothetical protein POSPLADRAFT_1155336, partial [Postia placenta MAD-698-R-SB12]
LQDTVKCANVQANGGSCSYPACNCAEPPKSKSVTRLGRMDLTAQASTPRGNGKANKILAVPCVAERDGRDEGPEAWRRPLRGPRDKYSLQRSRRGNQRAPTPDSDDDLAVPSRSEQGYPLAKFHIQLQPIEHSHSGDCRRRIEQRSNKRPARKGAYNQSAGDLKTACRLPKALYTDRCSRNYVTNQVTEQETLSGRRQSSQSSARLSPVVEGEVEVVDSSDAMLLGDPLEYIDLCLECAVVQPRDVSAKQALYCQHRGNGVQV